VPIWETRYCSRIWTIHGRLQRNGLSRGCIVPSILFENSNLRYSIHNHRVNHTVQEKFRQFSFTLLAHLICVWCRTHGVLAKLTKNRVCQIRRWLYSRFWQHFCYHAGAINTSLVILQFQVRLLQVSWDDYQGEEVLIRLEVLIRVHRGLLSRTI